MREWYVCGMGVAITIYNELALKIVHMQFKKIISSVLATGMTQKQLGDAVGCGQSAIGQIARGDTTDPRWSTVSGLLRVAVAKGVNVDWGEMGLYSKAEPSDGSTSSDGHVMRQEGGPPLVKELRQEDEHLLLKELRTVRTMLNAMLESGVTVIVVSHRPDC